jgi:hypothetical protein
MLRITQVLLHGAPEEVLYMYLLIWMFSAAQDLPNDVAKSTSGVF